MKKKYLTPDAEYIRFYSESELSDENLTDDPSMDLGYDDESDDSWEK